MKAYLLLSALIFMTLSLLLQPGVAAPNAQIQNDSSYVDIVGVYHLLGEVKNTGDMQLFSGLFGVKVTATLREQSGTLIDVIPTFLHIDRLPPGFSVGFDVVEIDPAKSAVIASYALTLDY